MSKADIGGDGRAVIPAPFNRATLAGYEDCARDYARSTAPRPGADEPGALGQLLNLAGPGSRLLEIGSGPGWDADWLEGQGVSVRRTDAAEAFVRFQLERGKPAERLDVLKDGLGGPYDAVLALYVLQHIDRGVLPEVLGKIAQALREGGAFLFSIREGIGETQERGSRGASYYVALWQRSALLAALQPLGLDLVRSELSEDEQGRWLTMLCTRSAA